ncbi:MAG: tRNA adenosine(34) deaminase TadA [Clostridia bacterium]|nr:tRNA adenosine(34) deaminase TadA [Clostridia bacterium]
MSSKEKYMQEALKEAKKAEKKQEVPIGAVIVYNGKIIARGHNLREKKKNSLYHAEIVSIDKACKKQKNFRLEDCELYVTIEPCLMCAGAIIQSRIKKVYFGARDPKYGAVISSFNAFEIKSNHRVSFEEGILEKECSDLIKGFFKGLREKRNFKNN